MAPNTTYKNLDLTLPNVHNIKRRKIGLQIINGMHKAKKAENYSLIFLNDDLLCSNTSQHKRNTLSQLKKTYKGGESENEKSDTLYYFLSFYT